MTRDKKTRDPLDRYYTDPRLAMACVDIAARFCRYHDEDIFSDPCCGAGAFTDAIEAYFRRVDSKPKIMACDLDAAAPYGRPYDVCDVADWNPGYVDHIIANPPYGPPTAIVATMRALQARTNARSLTLLLRGSAIERVMCGDDPPVAIIVSSQRPIWGGPGARSQTDTIGPALMVWFYGMAARTQIVGMPPWRKTGALRWPGGDP